VVWLGGSSASRTQQQIEQLAMRGVFTPQMHAAAGNGISDDATPLQSTITDATASGRGILALLPGVTYLINSQLVIHAPLVIEGNGATILKGTSLNAYALFVDGADVEIRDLTIDGNRAGGNSTTSGCYDLEGLRGVLRRCKAKNSKGSGIDVSGAGVVVDCFDCEASDIVTTSTTGVGFTASASGVLRCWGNCRADNNGQSGFAFSATAGAGCRVEGTANNNQFSGARLLSQNGTIGYFKSGNNQSYGIYGQNATGWTCAYFEDTDCGHSTNGAFVDNGAATALEILACDNWRFATVKAIRPLGYGVALGGLAGTGCSYCHFDSIYVDLPNDPAVFIGGNSHHNVFGRLLARGIIAVSFAENSTDTGNDHNTFGTVTAIECGYSVIRGSGCNHNLFHSVRAIDCNNHAPYTSLVEWDAGTTSCTDNVIAYWDSENPSGALAGTTSPAYVMLCDATATNNRILDGRATQYTTAAISDANGSNRVSFNRDLPVTATYSALITLNAASAVVQRITPTNTATFTINAPTNPTPGYQLVVDIGGLTGVMGVIIWNAAFKLAGAFTNPATTKRRTISFYYDGSNWIETNRAAADI